MSLLARKLLLLGTVAALDIPVAASVYTESLVTTTNHDITLPSGSAEGDLALLEFISNGSATHTAPSGSTTMITQTGAVATYDTFHMYGKILDATDIANNRLRVVTSSAQRAAGIMRRVINPRPGLVLNTDYAVSVEVAVNNATVDPASLTPAWGAARNLWISIGTSSDSNETFSGYSSGYGVAQANAKGGSAGNGCELASSCKFDNVASDDPGGISWNTAKNRLGYCVAIRPRS